jgi:MFS transporter, SHS family, lactate transporter
VGQPQRAAGSDHWEAAIAAYLGWTLDAFDFFLVVFTLTAIGRDFQVSDAKMAATIGVTLAFRPLGAFIFGLLADRYGRRRPLMINLVFYSVIEVASGLAPNFTTFVILRALFGIGMGGEWGVGASLVMEKVPPRLRGVLSGFLQQGYAMGNLLASAAFFLLFERFGWRPLFFVGGLPALLALFVRARVKESEVWLKTRHASWAHLGSAIARNWKTFVYIAILMTAMNLAAHGTQDMYPTFLKRQWRFGVGRVAGISAVSNGGGDSRRHAVRVDVGSMGTPAGDHGGAAGRDGDGAVVGAGAVGSAPGAGGVWHAVPGAGSVGRDPGAPRGALSGFGARLSARIRVPVRRAFGQRRALY